MPKIRHKIQFHCQVDTILDTRYTVEKSHFTCLLATHPYHPILDRSQHILIQIYIENTNFLRQNVLIEVCGVVWVCKIRIDRPDGLFSAERVMRSCEWWPWNDPTDKAHADFRVYSNRCMTATSINICQKNVCRKYIFLYRAIVADSRVSSISKSDMISFWCAITRTVSLEFPLNVFFIQSTSSKVHIWHLIFSFVCSLFFLVTVWFVINIHEWISLVEL